MGKYDGLGRYFKEEREEKKTLRFNEIEDILGFSLPRSARTHRPWWANDETHVQAKDGWLAAGWEVQSVDVRAEVATFHKVTKNSVDSGQAIGGKTTHYLTESDPKSFEHSARYRMSLYFKNELMSRQRKGWPKLFDMVSADFRIVGDAKYLSMVRGKYIPPAKFSVIAEHVWLLEKIDAEIRFLVFGNDIRVPKEWLRRYGELVNSVKFYFLTESGDIITLK